MNQEQIDAVTLLAEQVRRITYGYVNGTEAQKSLRPLLAEVERLVPLRRRGLDGKWLPVPEPIPGMVALNDETTWDRPLHEHEGEFATDSIVPEHHDRPMLDVLDSVTEQPIWWCADCGHKLPRKE